MSTREPGDRAGFAAMNLVWLLVVLLIVGVVIWLLFTLLAPGTGPTPPAPVPSPPAKGG